MGIKPTIEILPKQELSLPTRGNAVAVATPPQMVTVPVQLGTPITVWGAGRQRRYYDALRDATNAQSGYLRAHAEMAKSFVAAARATNEVAELPEICESDTQVRRLQRERDFLKARQEVEEARYGFYATQNEVDKLRKPRMAKALPNNAAAIDALMKAKVDREALGEDTTDLDHTIMALQRR